MCLWPLAQQLRQGAHEHMIAAIRFKVAIDEGNHLVRAIERAVIGQGQFRLWVWL